MRDTSKVTVLGGATSSFAKAQIQIYSAAGEGLLLFSVVISLRHFTSEADCRLGLVGPRQDSSFRVDQR